MENRKPKGRLKNLLNLANSISAKYRLGKGLNLSEEETSAISRRNGTLEDIFHNSEMEYLINEADNLDRMIDENHDHAKLYGNSTDIILYDESVTLEDASELRDFEGLPKYDSSVDDDLDYNPLDWKI